MTEREKILCRCITKLMAGEEIDWTKEGVDQDLQNEIFNKLYYPDPDYDDAND